MPWIQIHEGKYDGRMVVVSNYADDNSCLRIETTQRDDSQGIVIGDENSTIILPPTTARTRIIVETTTENFSKDIAECNFPEAEVQRLKKELNNLIIYNL
jgi:hypothetical protein